MSVLHSAHSNAVVGVVSPLTVSMKHRDSGPDESQATATSGTDGKNRRHIVG